MHKRRFFALALALVSLTTGLFGLPGTAQAAVPKRIGNFTQVHYTEDGYLYNHYATVAYHAKHKTHNAYVWNDTHTKKLANLKQHPNYTWYQLATGTYKGSKNWMRVTNFPDTKRGWIHKSQLKKGFNPTGYQILQKRYGAYAGHAFHLNSQTKNVYLWDWSHTKKRANLKHYTNQTFGQRHSILVRHNGHESWYSYVDVTIKGKTVSGYVQTKQLLKGRTPNHTGHNLLFPDDFVATADYQQYIRDSKYQKLAAVERLLAKQGYTPAKRQQLKGYKLGIYIINNLKGGRVDEAGNAYKGNWYGLVLAKPTR